MKACPHCGSDTVQTHLGRCGVGYMWRVVCVRGCEAEGPVATSEDEAVRLWNERPVEDTMREALRFYADEWEQDADAERTYNGWEGTFGDLEPSLALLEDRGNRARAALAKEKQDG